MTGQCQLKVDADLGYSNFYPCTFFSEKHTVFLCSVSLSSHPEILVSLLQFTEACQGTMLGTVLEGAFYKCLYLFLGQGL